jgi:CBS domain-containing protein
MRLRDIMSVGVVTVGPEQTVKAASTEMRRHGIRHLVVVDRGRVVGIVSERDLGERKGSELRGSGTVRDLMTAGQPVSASPATTLRQAANLMRGHTIGCLLVVEKGKLVGLVTTTDLLDQLGRGATRPTVRTEPAPVRRAPGAGRVRGQENIRRATGPRRGRRPPRRATQRRSALPASLPRPVKVTRGRTFDISPPAHIRVIGARLDQEHKDEVARKLGMKLGKFASSIERVSVRLFDANGPRGGVDQVCRVKVVLSGLPSVLVERRNSALSNAIDAAIRAAALAVRRSVQRRRLKPLHRRKPSQLRQTSSTRRAQSDHAARE